MSDAILHYTPASPDYSPASDSESDPSEDPSSDHIPPLPAISPFLSSDDDTTDSDTPDTPPSPTHGTPFTEITASTPEITYHTSSPMTSVPALSPVSGALSPVRADLIPSPKRVKDSGYLADVEDIATKYSAEINEYIAEARSLRDRGIDARVHLEDIPLASAMMEHRVTMRTCLRFGSEREQDKDLLSVDSAVTTLRLALSGLTRWFENGDLFNISNGPPKYQVKNATSTTCTNSLKPWWNSHKRTIEDGDFFLVVCAALYHELEESDDVDDRIEFLRT
ncbi:hypothetical protein Tco_0343249 [Tanacetum coccineum]